MSKREKRVEREKPQRVPVHRQNLYTPYQREGFHARWVNEVPGAVQRYLNAGWTLVQGQMENNEKRAQTETQLGNAWRMVVNRSPNAPCQTAVLMEIPKELYDEDYADAQKYNDYVMGQIDPAKHRVGEMDYGKLELK